MSAVCDSAPVLMVGIGTTGSRERTTTTYLPTLQPVSTGCGSVRHGHPLFGHGLAWGFQWLAGPAEMRRDRNARSRLAASASERAPSTGNRAGPCPPGHPTRIDPGTEIPRAESTRGIHRQVRQEPGAGPAMHLHRGPSPRRRRLRPPRPVRASALLAFGLPPRSSEPPMSLCPSVPSSLRPFFQQITKQTHRTPVGINPEWRRAGLGFSRPSAPQRLCVLVFAERTQTCAKWAIWANTVLLLPIAFFPLPCARFTKQTHRTAALRPAGLPLRRYVASWLRRFFAQITKQTHRYSRTLRQGATVTFVAPSRSDVRPGRPNPRPSPRPFVPSSLRPCLTPQTRQFRRFDFSTFRP